MGQDTMCFRNNLIKTTSFHTIHQYFSSQYELLKCAFVVPYFEQPSKYMFFYPRSPEVEPWVNRWTFSPPSPSPPSPSPPPPPPPPPSHHQPGTTLGPWNCGSTPFQMV